MEEFLNILNYYIMKLYNGNKIELSEQYDFIMLYLGRYENLFIEDHKILDNNIGCIYLKDHKNDSIFGRVFINSSGISIQIRKVYYVMNVEPYPVTELMNVTGKEYKGFITDFVKDTSGIIYGGLDAENPNYKKANYGQFCTTIFSNKGIIDKFGKIIQKFTYDSKEEEFDELMNYHANRIMDVHDSFYVGEYNVLEINVNNNLSDSEKEKMENNFRSVSDISLNIYKKLCDKSHVSEIEYIIQHIDLIDFMLNNHNYEYHIGDMVYKKDDNSYCIPIVFDQYLKGYVYIKTDEVGLYMENQFPGSDDKVEDIINIRENSFDGMISSMIRINEEGMIHILKNNTIFNDYGILDEDVSLPYSGENDAQIFTEILEYHNASNEELIESFSNSMKPIQVRMNYHPHVNPNILPDNLILGKDGKIYSKNHGRGKK